jgi:hypothetical protein
MPKVPPYSYVAYIDEAGDPGIDRVRPLDERGGSEWLTIGAVLIEAAQEAKPVQWRNEILRAAESRQSILHFRDLKDRQKPLACRQLANYPLIAFAMLSNKKNMRGYENPRAAARGNSLTSKQVFYNFCLRLILERITDFCLRHSTAAYGEPRLVKIIFSRRGGHSHGHTIAYNEILKAQNRSGTTWLKLREIAWQTVDRQLQEVWPMEEVAGLQLADVVASSFYQSVDILPPTVWNPENAKLLQSRMATESGFWRDYGVIFQPYPEMTRAQLKPQQKEIFEFYDFDTRDFDVPWFGHHSPWKQVRRVPASMPDIER